MPVHLPVISAPARAQLERLHGAIDALIAPLAALHGDRLQCTRGCYGCCRDDLTVFALEAARIVEHHAELLENQAPHAPGACAFLDGEGSCRVYAQRPYVCRTQGLPLRWLEEQAGEVVELRDICELNEAGPSLTELAAQDCFTLGPVEQRLRTQAEEGGAGQRVALRSLFRRAG